MVICTANSTTHVRTLAEKVRRQLLLSHIKHIGIEGNSDGEWMLVDFGDTIVHIMIESTRKFYNLEKLWGLDKIKESAARTESAEK
jgi:ribosome-associated protein